MSKRNSKSQNKNEESSKVFNYPSSQKMDFLFKKFIEKNNEENEKIRKEAKSVANKRVKEKILKEIMNFTSEISYQTISDLLVISKGAASEMIKNLIKNAFFMEVLWTRLKKKEIKNIYLMSKSKHQKPVGLIRFFMHLLLVEQFVVWGRCLEILLSHLTPTWIF